MKDYAKEWLDYIEDGSHTDSECIVKASQIIRELLEVIKEKENADK